MSDSLKKLILLSISLSDLPASLDRIVDHIGYCGFDREALLASVKELIDSGAIELDDEYDSYAKSIKNPPELKDFPGLELSEQNIMTLYALKLVIYREAIYFEDFSDHYSTILSIFGAGEDEGVFIKCLLESGLIVIADGRRYCYVAKNSSLTEEFEKELDALIIGRRGETRNKLLKYLEEKFELAKHPALLSALKKIDRADFLPSDARSLADLDIPLGTAGDITTSALHAIVMTLRELDLQKGERVLICGLKGSVTAALSREIVGDKGRVVCVEHDVRLIESARKPLEKYFQGPNGVELIEARDITIGYEHGSPWDVCIFNGNLAKIPYDVIQQLCNERGRILFYMQDPGRESATCYIIKKNEEILRHKELSQFLFTPIYGKYGFDSIKELEENYENSKKANKNSFKNIEFIQTRSPYPLSQIFLAAINCVDPSEKHAYTIKLFEVLMKYFAFSTICEFGIAKIENAQISEQIVKIGSKPSNGDWLQLLKLCGEHIKSARIGSMVYEDMFETRKEKEIANAYKILIESVQSRTIETAPKVSVFELFRKIVEYRNKYETHGTILHVEDKEKNSRALLEAASAIIIHSRLCNKADLVKFEDIHYNDAGDGLVVNIRKFKGNTPRCDVWEIPGKPDIKKGFYLCCGNEPLLRVSPWFVYGRGNFGDDLFIYNSRSGSENQYLTYYNQNKFPPDAEQRDIENLVKTHKDIINKGRSKTEIENSNLVFEGMLSAFANDGKISAEELAVLASHLIRYGMVGTQEEALSFVKKIVETKYPGVYFEE